MDNIALARKAWSHYTTKPYILNDGAWGASLQSYFDALADDVVWIHEGPETPGVYEATGYPGVIRGKQALLDLTATKDIHSHGKLALEDDSFLQTSMEFVADGDRVVMLVEERYYITKSDITVRHSHVAVIMDFRDGLITKIRVIGNLVDWIQTYMGVGWSAMRI